MDSLSLTFELRIIRARNIYLKTSRELFVRCYLPTGNKKRVRIDSQEIPSTSTLTWNQTFSLNCSGNEAIITSLKQEAVVFELRCRNSTPLIAKMSGSKLLARAEMPWNDVVQKTNVETEKWVVMTTTKNSHVYSDDVKPPAVQVALKVEESAERVVRKKGCESWSGCGCMEKGCNCCVGYEFFALEAALEAF